MHGDGPVGGVNRKFGVMRKFRGEGELEARLVGKFVTQLVIQASMFLAR